MLFHLFILFISEVLAQAANRGNSLEFVLPSLFAPNQASIICSRYSSYWCLGGFVTEVQRRRNLGRFARKPESTDISDFTSQLRNQYKSINWYALDGTPACCMYQSQIYLKQGQEKGISPSEYMALVQDFSSDDSRVLNYVEAWYNSELCVNEIVKVGFGCGQFKRNGGRNNVEYITPAVTHLTPGVNPKTTDVHRFSFRNITQELTFDWFKKEVICKDKDWICIQWAPKRP